VNSWLTAQAATHPEVAIFVPLPQIAIHLQIVFADMWNN
jgi:hypothetical protein